MATSTDVPIYTNTLTGTASSVTIDLSTYQDYTDVKIVYSAQSSGGNAVLTMRFNGDSGSNYSSTYAYGTGSTAASGKETNQSALSAGDIPSSSSNAFSANTIYLHNYSNTNTYKTALMRHNSPGVVTVMSVGTWRSTSAITSVTLLGSFNTGSTISVYGIGTKSPAKATGGAIYSDNNYWYHVFTSTGTFTPSQTLTADILSVAGGGGGWAGAGGAGGHVLTTSQSLVGSSSYTCTVGAGGPKMTTGGQGGNSNVTGGALSLTAAVGGGYGGGGSGMAGGNGGSGGGGGWGFGAGGSGTAGQGYAGGQGTSGGGGAGGGAGGAASNPNGGPGINTYSSSYLTATSIGDKSGTDYYISSGGGWPSSVGGGGYAVAGKPNTGGGGGGDNNGGSGFVIVRYAK